MAELAALISNPGHHVATLAPVATWLTAQGVATRILSLCELRGFETPLATLETSGAEVVLAWPPRMRRSTKGTELEPGPESRRRSILRSAAWHTFLKPRIRAQFDSRTRLAVLPNDSAYPYDRIVSWLHRRGVPYLLLQEGIRFPLPTERNAHYGLGGAATLAVWGEASAQHFRAAGVSDAALRVTGCPRFDGEHRRRWPFERTPGTPPRVTVFTNPIDAQGFCSPHEKTALLARFTLELRGAIESGRIVLQVRPHPGESHDEYRMALPDEDQARVHFDTSPDLATAIDASDIAVVMASTVGLEALKRGVPLAVLPLPGHGHVHDYVERRAALGITWESPLSDRLLERLEQRSATCAAVNDYLDSHLAPHQRATQAVGELIIELLNDD